uniref:Uncharacterized protein n=1 Tax=Anguilla anguilla TaxID=7936 RepID=A0A0E9XR20_ANGAN
MLFLGGDAPRSDFALNGRKEGESLCGKVWE